MSQRLLKAALLAALAAGVLLGTASAQKGGGTSSKDIPMKAIFSDGSDFRITGDAVPYVHQGSQAGQTYIVLDGNGSFVMAAYSSTGRNPNLLFDTCWSLPTAENPVECADPYFLPPQAFPVQSTYFFLRTYWKCRYIAHVEEDGTTWTELIRSTTRRDAAILNLKTMSPGETVGVSVEMMRFRVTDNALTPGYDESQDLYGLTGRPLPGMPGSAAYVLVTATDWNGDGVMEWILRSIPGKIVIKQYDRADDVLLQGDAFRTVSDWPCEYGSFILPFELKIAKK